MATINLRDLRNPSTEAPTEAADRGTFKAGQLHVTVCDDQGNEVAEFTMDPRAFTPKAKGDQAPVGGVGWYSDLKAKDGAKYRGLSLSGGFRFSLHGVKIGVGDTVDLTGDDE